MYYNVWSISYGRWRHDHTVLGPQDCTKPYMMSWDQASKSRLMARSPDDLEIREINADYSCGKTQTTDPGVYVGSTNVSSINDYVCTTCKNDRVSQAEKSKGIPCWKCGGKL